MPNSQTPPDTPTTHMQISEALIVELIGLLKNVIENSGTGRTAQQMQELILELSYVARSMDKLNRTLEKINNQPALASEINTQKVQIAQIEQKVSRMYPLIFEPDTQGD